MDNTTGESSDLTDDDQMIDEVSNDEVSNDQMTDEETVNDDNTGILSPIPSTQSIIPSTPVSGTSVL